MKSTSRYKNIIIMIWVLVLWSFFANAQTNSTSNSEPTWNDESGTCLVCGATPSQIEDFITLAENILWVLWTKYTAGIQAGQYKVFWPWQWGLYWSIASDRSNNSSIYRNIVNWTLRNIDQKQSYIRTTAVLLGTYTKDTITDGAMWFAVVAQPWPMVRDYQRLLDIETIISDKIYELGIAWWYTRTIDSDSINSIRELFNNEVWWERIFNDVYIQDDMKAKDILQVLRKLNNKHKNLVVLWAETKSNEVEDIKKGNDTVVIDLNPNYRDKLKSDYHCARLWTKGKMQCSKQFSQFKKSIKNITKNFIETGPKASLEKIKVASRRLRTRWQQIAGNTNNDFYKENIKDYEDREAELLSIQWVEKRTTPWLSGLLWGNISRSVINTIQDWKLKIPSIANSIKEWINELKTTNTWINSMIKKDIQGEEKAENTSIWQSITNIWNSIKDFFWTEKKSEITKTIEKNIVSNIINTTIDHEKQLQRQSLASTDDSIDKLTDILITIRFLNTMIYNPWDESTIYENIVRTCELQCSNLWWTCR